MKIGIVSSTVPHMLGGYRLFVEQLEPHLKNAGHEVETIWLPFSSDPKTLLAEIAAFRMMDLRAKCDLVICCRTPAHVIRHPRKVVWFIHHERVFYDLWDSKLNSIPKTEYWINVRKKLIEADSRTLQEARAVFTNSKVVSDRLQVFNEITSEVLYPPIADPESFSVGDYGPELIFICRILHHKRQHLAVEAMAHTKTPVRLRLAGQCHGPEYLASLQRIIKENGLDDRVSIDNRWISEGEKKYLLSRALANVYVPIDEDSYGYPTLEAAHSRRATVSVSDAGGVGEFVLNEQCGLITEPCPEALGRVFDRLWLDRALAKRLGCAAETRISDLKISWQHVVARLTA